MSAVDVRPSSNGLAPEGWSASWTHLRVDRRSPSYCRVTFDHPPTNTITGTTVIELAELVELIAADVDLNVVVFDSANPDFYLGHHDIEQDPANALHTWLALLRRLARAPVVSVASVRGRARGVGSEFVFACDLCFASRENTLIEILLVGDELDASRAEQYGYVNRLIADDRLDDEVDVIATRLASFDHEVIARAKSGVGELGVR